MTMTPKQLIRYKRKKALQWKKDNPELLYKAAKYLEKHNYKNIDSILDRL